MPFVAIWRETLVFFMGLFVMVAALVHTGVIEAIGTWAVDAVGTNYFGAATALLSSRDAG